MKKNNNEPTMIKDGFIDYYYCYKLSKRKDYYNIYRKLLQNICCIAKFDINNNGEVSHYSKVDFTTFLSSQAEKFATKIMEDIHENLKDITNNHEPSVTVTAYKSTDTPNNNVNNHENSDNRKVRFAIPFPLEDFVNESIILTKEFIDQNNLYFNKNLKFYNYNLILQPLKILIDGIEHFVNVRVNIYGTGNLILHYTIPIKNIEFSSLYTLNNNLNYTTFLPSYIVHKNESYDYIGEFEFEEAIKLYNKYILDTITIKCTNSNSFTNYTLIDYSNIPSEFDNASQDLKRELYWLVNWPYGYLNEQEKNKYNDFIKNRYSISLYSSLFTSTNSRTVIAYNSKKTNIEDLDNLFESPKYKYNIAFMYLAPAIEMLMIKQTYYSDIASYKISKDTTLKKLTGNYKNLIDINNEVFRLTFGGYGSMSSLIEYLEESLIDFLPQEKIENLLNNYKEFISINESESGEKRNYILSLLAVLFPIFFGLNAIELLTTSLDKYLNFKYKTYSINLISESSLYAVEIWFTVVIISIILIYRHYIYYIIDKFSSFISYVFNRIKVLIGKYYYKFSYYIKEKLKELS